MTGLRLSLDPSDLNLVQESLEVFRFRRFPVPDASSVIANFGHLAADQLGQSLPLSRARSVLSWRTSLEKENELLVESGIALGSDKTTDDLDNSSRNLFSQTKPVLLDLRTDALT